jgi:hypothetical protein
MENSGPIFEEAPEVQEHAERTDFERVRNLPPVEKMTREAALTEIAKTRADKEHPYNSSNHWHRQRALDRMDKLYQLAYPEPTAEDKQRELAQVEKESTERKKKFADEAAEKKRREAESKLKEEIMADPDLAKRGITYEKAVKLAQGVLQARGITEEDEDFLFESNWGNDARLVRALLTIAQVEEEKRAWLKGKRSR